jgi:hypothetical protein
VIREFAPSVSRRGKPQLLELSATAATVVGIAGDSGALELANFAQSQCLNLVRLHERIFRSQ